MIVMLVNVDYLIITICVWTVEYKGFLANMRRSPDAGLMLGQRLRRWPNIKPACLVLDPDC